MQAGLETPAAAYVISSLALQDYYSGNTTWRDLILNNSLHIYATQHPGFPTTNPTAYVVVAFISVRR
jgi:hypothetical protein